MRYLVLALVVMGLVPSFSPAKTIDPQPNDTRPVVQIAILLDTSNSMDGLINQAKTQLWRIVNEFSRCKRDGQSPRLQVALYEYGNNNLIASEGYIRQVLPMGEDLDALSEKLFALKTNGGNEYCGQVIDVALQQIEWSNDPKVFKAIFIAGNEPFTQGQVDYRVACGKASGKGVIVNTIHCGPERVGIEGMWADGAGIAGGKAMNIDQDRCVEAIRAPQDDEITALSAELNKTYIPYGEAGEAGATRQAAQDANAVAEAASGSAVQRSVSKAGPGYNNSGWDLLDALASGSTKLQDVADKDLPKEMQSMSESERKAYVEQQQTRRGDIQKKIKDLNTAREKFVAEEEKKRATDGAETFDSAVLKTVQEQMSARGYDAK